jgi:hydrogenase small subunit
MTSGLSCDGDSVSTTAATLPSIEDVVMGNIPGLPKVHLHNPVLAYEVGDDFMKYWHMAAEGKLEPFVLVLEGSVPNEDIKSEGYWAAMGTDPHTGQPITTSEWIDRLAPRALAIVAPAHAPLTAASMPWKAIPRARWASLIISAGIGVRRRACPS